MSQDAEKLKFILGFKHLFWFWAAKLLYNEKIARISVFRWNFENHLFNQKISSEKASPSSVWIFFHNEINSGSEPQK